MNPDRPMTPVPRRTGMEITPLRTREIMAGVGVSIPEGQVLRRANFLHAGALDQEKAADAISMPQPFVIKAPTGVGRISETSRACVKIVQRTPEPPRTLFDVGRYRNVGVTRMSNFYADVDEFSTELESYHTINYSYSDERVNDLRWLLGGKDSRIRDLEKLVMQLKIEVKNKDAIIEKQGFQIETNEYHLQKLWKLDEDEEYSERFLNDSKWKISFEVIEKIVLFLDDDDLFELRSVSTQFYDAYLNQTTKDIFSFNCERGHKLAIKGRVFKNVSYFSFGAWFNTPFREDSFPGVRYVHLGDPSLGPWDPIMFMPQGWETPKTLMYSAHGAAWGNWRTSFPAIDEVVFPVVLPRGGVLNFCRGRPVKTFVFPQNTVRMYRWNTDFADITRANFPHLRTVEFSHCGRKLVDFDLTAFWRTRPKSPSFTLAMVEREIARLRWEGFRVTFPVRRDF